MANEAPKNPASHLHIINLFIAAIAGLISIVGGVYSLKTNVFTPKTGKLQGIVMDERIARPLLLANVEVSETSGAVVATVNTDAKGWYSVKSLKEGSYTVSVSAPLHQTQSKDVKVYPGTESNVSFELLPEGEKPFRGAEEVQTSRSIPAQNYPTYSPPQEQAPSAPSPYSRQTSHRRYSRTSTNSSGENLPNQSTSDVIVQTLGQFVQDWMSKKNGR